MPYCQWDPATGRCIKCGKKKRRELPLTPPPESAAFMFQLLYVTAKAMRELLPIIDQCGQSEEPKK